MWRTEYRASIQRRPDAGAVVRQGVQSPVGTGHIVEVLAITLSTPPTVDRVQTTGPDLNPFWTFIAWA
jgi:hypothetical protein